MCTFKDRALRLIASSAALLLSVPALAQDVQAAVALAKESCSSDGYDAEACERAIGLLEGLSPSASEDIEAQLALAKAYWNSGRARSRRGGDGAQRRQKSVALLQRWVNRNTSDARPYYELSMTVGNRPERIPLLRKASQLNPKHPAANRDLANALLDEGQVDESVKAYEAHLSANPPKERADGIVHLGFAERVAMRGQGAKANVILEKVWRETADERPSERCRMFRQIDPRRYGNGDVTKKIDEVRPYCTRTERLEKGAALEKQGKRAEAIAELEAQIAENPSPPETWTLLERLYGEQGEAERAVKLRTRYLSSEPNPREKCNRFRALAPKAKAAMEPALREKLTRECK